MIRAAFVAIFTLVLGLCASLPGSAGSERPKANFESFVIRDLLTKSGYIHAHIDFTEMSQALVRGKIRETECRILIDTGTNASLIHQQVARKFELSPRTERSGSVTSVGGSKAEEIKFTKVPKFQIGGADLEQVDVVISDVWPGTKQGNGEALPFEILLGDSILSPARAIVDLSGGELFLQTQGNNAIVPEALEKCLRNEGYSNLICAKQRVPRIKCKIGHAELNLIVDTGAPFTILDRSSAVRAGVLQEDSTDGAAKPRPSEATVPLSLPLEFSSDIMQRPPNAVGISDLSNLNMGLEKNGAVRTDGLLGMNTLRHFRAILDYSGTEPRIFLIDPIDCDSKMLDGDWIGDSIETDGKELSKDDASKYRLKIIKDRFGLQTNTLERFDLRFDVMFADPPIKWFDLNTEGSADKKHYPCLYEVSRHFLRICMPVTVNPGEKLERPKRFTSSNPYSVLTFRRDVVASK